MILYRNENNDTAGDEDVGGGRGGGRGRLEAPQERSADVTQVAH